MAQHFKIVAVVVGISLAIIVVCSVKRWENNQSNDVIGPGRFADPSLKFVAVLFRHGNRAPTFKYNTDPHKNAFPEGEGELTKKGKQNMYKKGQIFRRLYNGFLSDLYLDSEILIKTTKKRRTFMTAAMVLAGMYPPKHYQKWSDSETVWQPIPIYNDSPDNTLLLEQDRKCPSYDAFHETIFPQLIDTADENITALISLLSNFTENCGQPITEFNILYLNDLFLCQIAEGLQLPEWIKPYHLAIMKSVLENNIYSKLCYENPKMMKLILGPLLNEIGLNMESRSNNYNTTRKMHLYSGHDISVAMTLSFISNAFELPDFGSSVHFHLYDDEINGYIIKVFFFDRWDNENGKELLTPICGNPCKFEDFKTLLTKNFSENWEDVCQNI